MSKADKSPAGGKPSVVSVRNPKPDAGVVTEGGSGGDAGGGGGSSPPKPKCWEFQLVKLVLPFKDVRVGMGVSGKVAGAQLSIYSSGGERMGEAPQAKSAQIVRACEKSGVTALAGSVISKRDQKVEVKLCAA